VEGRLSERSFRRDYQRRLSAARRRHELRARKTAVAAVAVGAFALAAPATSSAANLVVGSGADTTGAVDCATPTNTDCTLRQAILDANANAEDDTITFASSITGTITLTSGPLVVNSVGPTYHGLTITGPGSGTLAVSGNDASSVLEVERTGYDPGLTITGLTLTHGDGTYGGALYTDLSSNVTLDHDAVTTSTASGDVVSTGPFSSNVAGGGITNVGTMAITNTTISGNDSATGTGGSTYGGGGIDNIGRLTVDASTISGNTADQFGGGIFQGASKYPSSLDISNSTILDNSAQYAGGGIAAFNKPIYGSSRNSITNTTIVGNGAYAGGGFGGKYVNAAEHWTISHSTFTGNGSFYGGGINLGIVTGSFDLVDSTISGNEAQVGGGVNMFENASKYQDSSQFNNSTIASNYANDTGGGIYLGNTYGPSSPPNTVFPVPLFSTIVADNQQNGPDNDLEVNDPSRDGFGLSFSLVEAPGNATITQTPAGSSILGVDPQLGALGDNGGPTLTQLPAITSPVVDKGSAPGSLTTDQRGQPRTVDTSCANASDGTDIGSVELAAGPPPPPPGPTPAGGGSAGTKVHGIKKKHKKRKHVLRTKKKSVKIHVTFSSGNPAVTFRCSVDGGPAVPCTSPFSPKVSSAPGKGKVHTVTITTVDSSGNVVGKPRTVRFRIIRED
jgi:hypothetical protein